MVYFWNRSTNRIARSATGQPVGVQRTRAVAEMAKADSIAVDVASSDQQASVKSVAASIELDAANKVRRPDISLVDADQTGRQPEAEAKIKIQSFEQQCVTFESRNFDR